MSNKTIKRTLATAIGAALVGSMSFTASIQAAENPFGMQELDGGYMQVAMKEGSCGGDKKTAEGNCGGEKMAAEGSCGGDKTKEGSCGESKKKPAEGKCGEGKCGGSK